MKNMLICLIPGLILAGCHNQPAEKQYAQLQKAYQEHNYFKLDALMSRIGFNKRDPDLLLYQSKLEFVFNHPGKSNQLIGRLLDRYPDRLPDSVVADLYYMRAVNADRMEDYKGAYMAGKVVTEKYAHFYDSSFIGELRDDNLIRKTLTGVPKMEIEKKSETRIPLKRDLAGLLNIPVTMDHDTIDFIFDTGANLSVVVKSLATKYHAKILGNKVNVYGFTGKRFESEIGLINFKLGDVDIRNSVFLVFPDSLLSFAGGAYVIRGVIGFPIMNELQEIIIKDDKQLILPIATEDLNLKNFILDDATPVILVNYKNDTLPFHFDTGAVKTVFFATFLNRYNGEITDQCEKTNVIIAGAGDNIRTETYLMDSVIISAGNVQSQLDSILILTESLSHHQENVYGNFGQDFIQNYSEMTINFESMWIRFANPKKDD
jgi:predicted aspartyl protease